MYHVIYSFAYSLNIKEIMGESVPAQAVKLRQPVEIGTVVANTLYLAVDVAVTHHTSAAAVQDIG